MALIYNSLEWSLKCNSDDDAVNGGDAIRALNAFILHGGSVGGRNATIFLLLYANC